MSLFLFKTFGCQMNTADSDDLRRELVVRGYEETTDPSLADIMIVNTCSVREHAEQRAKVKINELVRLKKRDALLWVIGCMAQRLGDSMKNEIKGIDLVVGAKESSVFLQKLDYYLPEYNANTNDNSLKNSISDFVAVMRGCNNYCSYCIVPHVRGPETSLSVENVLEKIRQRVSEGISEITLLGQNVNSYRDGDVDFADLLKMAASVSGVKRVRFTTSHPKDCSEKLIRTIADNSTICNHIHLPVQAGSDKILAQMNRQYTADHYINLITMIRSFLPYVDITSDIMVGFPGETEKDFEDTLNLIEKVQFTTAFMFAYSSREGTAAASIPNKVPSELKKQRLKKMIDLQTSITKSIYYKMVGNELEVMITGRQEKRDKLWMGIDNGFKKVLLACNDAKAGMILKVRAQRSSGMTLICERV